MQLVYYELKHYEYSADIIRSQTRRGLKMARKSGFDSLREHEIIGILKNKRLKESDLALIISLIGHDAPAHCTWSLSPFVAGALSRHTLLTASTVIDFAKRVEDYTAIKNLATRTDITTELFEVLVERSDTETLTILAKHPHMPDYLKVSAALRQA